MEIIYFRQVSKFLERIEVSLAARVVHHIDLLSKYSNDLKMPYTKSLGKNLHELRIVGDKHVRIFYCFHKSKIYLLPAIIKKQRAIPNKDIDISRKRIKMVASI